MLNDVAYFIKYQTHYLKETCPFGNRFECLGLSLFNFVFLCCAGVLEDHDLKTLSSSADESEVETCFVMSELIISVLGSLPVRTRLIYGLFPFRGAGNLADLVL